MTTTLIAPIRILLFGLLTILNTMFMYFIYYNYKDTNIEPIRRQFIYIQQLLARFSLFIIGYYWIEENYEENINNLEDIDEPNVIISNHVSFLDTYYYTSKLTFNVLVNHRFRNIPLLGKTMEKYGAIFVGDKKVDANDVINKLAHSKNLNRPLLIFPEGGTKNNNYLYNFKLGAFRPLAPIRPVLLNYNQKYCDASWTYSYSPVITLYLLCCQFYNTLEVSYMKTIKPDNDNIENYKDKAENVYLQKGLIKSNLEIADNIFFGKLVKESDELGRFAYDNYLKCSVANIKERDMWLYMKIIDFYNKSISKNY